VGGGAGDGVFSGCGRWEVAAIRENFIMFSISLDIRDRGKGGDVVWEWGGGTKHKTF